MLPLWSQLCVLTHVSGYSLSLSATTVWQLSLGWAQFLQDVQADSSNPKVSVLHLQRRELRGYMRLLQH